MLVIKVKYGEDTRRVTISQIPQYSELVALLQKLFEFNDYIIKYEDTDGDQVTISSDMELTEAINLATNSQGNMLRLFLSSNKTSLKSFNSLLAPKNPSSKDGKQEIPKVQTPNNSGPTPPTFTSPFNPILQLLNNPQIVGIIPSLLQSLSQISQDTLNSVSNQVFI